MHVQIQPCKFQKTIEGRIGKTHLMKSRNQLQRKAFVTPTISTCRKSELVYN